MGKARRHYYTVEPAWYRSTAVQAAYPYIGKLPEPQWGGVQMLVITMGALPI